MVLIITLNGCIVIILCPALAKADCSAPLKYEGGNYGMLFLRREISCPANFSHERLKCLREWGQWGIVKFSKLKSNPFSTSTSWRHKMLLLKICSIINFLYLSPNLELQSDCLLSRAIFDLQLTKWNCSPNSCSQQTVKFFKIKIWSKLYFITQ